MTLKRRVLMLRLGDNPPRYELFADRTRPPLEVVHDIKLLGLTIDSSLSFKAHIKSVRLMSKLVLLGEFVNSYLQK